MRLNRIVIILVILALTSIMLGLITNRRYVIYIEVSAEDGSFDMSQFYAQEAVSHYVSKNWISVSNNYTRFFRAQLIPFINYIHIVPDPSPVIIVYEVSCPFYESIDDISNGLIASLYEIIGNGSSVRKVEALDAEKQIRQSQEKSRNAINSLREEVTEGSHSQKAAQPKGQSKGSNAKDKD